MFFPGPVTVDQRRGIKKNEDRGGGVFRCTHFKYFMAQKALIEWPSNEAPIMSEKEKFMNRETRRFLKRQYDLFDLWPRSMPFEQLR